MARACEAVGWRPEVPSWENQGTTRGVSSKRLIEDFLTDANRRGIYTVYQNTGINDAYGEYV